MSFGHEESGIRTLAGPPREREFVGPGSFRLDHRADLEEPAAVGALWSKPGRGRAGQAKRWAMHMRRGRPSPSLRGRVGCVISLRGHWTLGGSPDQRIQGIRDRVFAFACCVLIDERGSGRGVTHSGHQLLGRCAR